MITNDSRLMASPTEKLEKVETFQNLLIAHATGGNAEERDYVNLRRELLDDPELASLYFRASFAHAAISPSSGTSSSTSTAPIRSGGTTSGGSSGR